VSRGGHWSEICPFKILDVPWLLAGAGGGDFWQIALKYGMENIKKSNIEF
jgi:hypothetical protein